MKKILCLGLSLLLLLLLLFPAAAEGPNGAPENEGAAYDRDELTVGNPTPMRGRFFTSAWGGTTTDIDVRELLHGYCLVVWDGETGATRFDRSVVSGAVAQDDAQGNRTYFITLYDDLFYSDGSPITAWDYAFSLLLQMDPVVAQVDGDPLDVSWLLGSEEYLSGESAALEGLRVTGDYSLRITVKAEAMPYFYELSRFFIKPYPRAEIAPGCEVRDDGEGAYLTPGLSAEELEKTILDPETGYLTHPRVVSGPYTLVSFDGQTAEFRANEWYKGDEKDQKPRIGTLRFTLARNEDMMQRLGAGEFGLLNKVTFASALLEGVRLNTGNHPYSWTGYPRVGLTLVWFQENSAKVQEKAVRQAIAFCLDREGFVADYVGPFGMVMDGFYGLGQWMYGLVNGTVVYDPDLGEDPTPEETAAYEKTVADLAEINLDGLTLYSLDVDEAVRLLEEAGWTLGPDGAPYDPARHACRSKRIDGELVSLDLILDLTESEEAQAAMEENFLPYLAQAGIRVTLRRRSMEDMEIMYEEDERSEPDLLYLGENFSVTFDPDIFLPGEEDNEINAVRAQVRAMAQEMTRTEPGDVAGFMRKWVAMQERITQDLPLLPVYSNVYFDFYTRELYDYRIAEAVTWAGAVVPAYLDEAEKLGVDWDAAIEEKLEEIEQILVTNVRETAAKKKIINQYIDFSSAY